MVRQFQQVTGADYAPVEVQLMRPRPAGAAAHEAHVRCPVRFCCPHDMLASDVSWLDQPLPTANAMSFRLAVERLIRRALPRARAVASSAG